MAGGFTIKKENINKFKDFLLKNYKKLISTTSEVVNLYLDSVIAPTALNERFFDEVNYLSPFGSGNNEPKFVLENLRVLNSNIIRDSHIKNILIGKDGSTFKSIAFNAKNTPLEPYLSKNNKKEINIAGKMKMNEWRGRKTVEFEIEDISLN